MTNYTLLSKQLGGLIETDNHYVPVLSNASAIIWEAMSDINWAGFYIIRDGRLVLGPFQGKVACIHIEQGKGVCGTAWDRDEIMLVDDVHAFPGHIACDSASNSEIVLPIHHEGRVVAVLDIDSPLLSRFTEEDKAGLSEIVKTIEAAVWWESC